VHPYPARCVEKSLGQFYISFLGIMGEILDIIESGVTDFWTELFKSVLFFLNQHQQSIIVSFIHYTVFIIGFYFFFFQSNPKDIFRIIFFLFVALGALSYFIFNKCFFTSIELNLSNNEKNPIQAIMDNYFGCEIEGNMTSKIVLSASTVVTGLTLLKDYGYIGPKSVLNKAKDRDAEFQKD
jgi:hypothetical protein